MITWGGAFGPRLSTTTSTSSSAVLPRSSLACAMRRCGPSVKAERSHVKENEELVSVRKGAPASTENATLTVEPSGSDALPETSTEPATRAPPWGPAMATTGGAFVELTEKV